MAINDTRRGVLGVPVHAVPIPNAAARPRVLSLARLPEALSLAAVLAIAAALDFFGLSRLGYANTYYAAAVRSMLQSWHNFFFVSFDPGGFVTVDKPPLGFWLQTASAKLFGFHGWSILLPQALAGVLSVALLFFLVRRVWGPVAGLVAALALALTPVAVQTNRNNTIDSLLVLCLLLGAWAVSRAAETGRLRWLVAAMALVGLGFNIKMLEAYLVLPAFYLLYLAAAPHGWLKRIAHLGLVSIVLVVVSLSWAVTVDLIPASQRPYVGSSQHNSELELALGYNGLERLLGRGLARPAQPAPPAETSARSGADLPADGADAPANAGNAFRGGPGGPGGQGENGQPGVFRLFNQQLGGQASWLLPLGIAGIAVAWRSGIRRRPHRREQTLLLWGTWLLTGAAFFSVAGYFHSYYLVTIAPAAAALAGSSLVALWRAYRRPGWAGWLLPVVLLATAAAQAYLLRAYPDWSRWLTPLTAGLCLLAAAVLAIARLRRNIHLPLPALAGAAALGMLALLIAPAIWSGVTVSRADASGLQGAGPRSARSFGPPPGMVAAGEGVPVAPGSFNPQPNVPDGNQGGGPPVGGREQVDAKLLSYLETNRGGARFLVATPNAMSASPIILQTGEPVMALGGFLGSDPTMTAAQLAQAVQDGTIRFFLVSGGGRREGNTNSQRLRDTTAVQDTASAGEPFMDPMPGGFGGGNGLESWVTSHCSAVPASAYGASATSSGDFGQQLYDCAQPAG